ncbi:MAG: ribosome biogenesis GTPase Der [Aquificota bacterium]|jgi:GTP-binding protein|nr:ribosome biogenesis GTPase Der [Aquificaceae bacterium]HCO38607.1 ribosome biogenesis GTPase Der [Aquificaceae bacterium]
MADVLIVGRPNVGKSTLFNRLIKRRKSIVHDLPGVTRDMVEGIAHWRGKSFSVADTGGVLERGDEITEAIKRQVQKVLEGAKAIIFVVDGREGLTAGDEYLARLIYPYKDKVFVAVNKIDSQKLEDRVYEFYSLGFERLFPISAQHGRGVDELLDKLVEILPEEEERPLEGIKIAFLGRPNVGKSSLVNALLKEERVIVSPIPGTTRDAIEVPFSFEGKDFILVDTAGIRRRSKVEYGVEFFSVGRSIKAIELSDICCLVIDLSEGVVDQDKRIGGLIERRYKGCVIVGNKMDLIKANRREVEAYLRRELSFLDYAPIVLTSAIKGQGVEDILRACELVWEDYNIQHKTSFINRAVEKVLREKHPPSQKGKEVKVYYAFQESTRPPTVVVFTNDPELWRKDYLRFFQRRLREHLNIRYAPLRLILKGREEEKL